MKYIYLAAVLTACLGLFALPGKGQTSPASADNSNSRLDITLSLFDVGLRNIPLSVRNVPPNPADSSIPGYTTPGPIPQTSLSNPASLSLGYTVARARSGQTTVSTRIRWWIYPNSAFFSPGSNIAEYNYTNAPGTSIRGTGAALTFMGLEQRGLVPAIRSLQGFNVLTNFSPEVRLSRSVTIGGHKQHLSLTVSYFTLDVVTGWDRYDSLEESGRTTLAYCFPFTLGMEFGHFEIGAQATLALGRSVEPVTPSLVVGWSF